MGIIRAGILSRVSGKVAGVVGGSWKDKAYLREYVIPANPDTNPQKVQRALMRMAVSYGKPLVGSVFNPYTDKFERSMSGFNRFVADNIALMTAVPTFTSIKMTNGKLWTPQTLTVGYATTVLTLTFDGVTHGNNGAATDKIYAASVYRNTVVWYFPAAEVARSAGVITITVPAGLDVTKFHTYLWAAQYSPTSPTLLQMISNSIYSTAT